MKTLYQILINGIATKFIYDNAIDLDNAITVLKNSYDNIDYLIINF